jgi:uncharacterized protein (DUF433 family)
MENSRIQHIESTLGVRGGKSRIVDTRITVADIAILHLKLGKSVAEIAGEYDLALAAVYAALAYYFDHQMEIDQQIEVDKLFAETFRQQNPSKLQAKLKELQ